VGTSLTLFKVFGIQVRVHWSFILILIYGAFSSIGGQLNPILGALYGILVILLLFVCVTLHEFGHALVAQYYKVNVSSITLLPIGGVASLERMPDKPLEEFLIAIAGPLVNFALAVLLIPLAFLAYNFSPQSAVTPLSISNLLAMTQTPSLVGLLINLTLTNIGLALFNLLPAFPMDGGRILRALLAMGMSYVQATRIAVFVGRLMAVLFAIWGIWNAQNGGILLLLIAFFIYVGGGSEREAVESRAVLKNILAGQALTPSAQKLYTSEHVNRAVDLIMSSYQTDYPVMDLGGAFVGVLTRARLIYALQTNGPEARIVDVMIPAAEVPVCSPRNDLSIVWEKMAETGSRNVAIKDGGNFMGLITIDDINEVFQVIGAAMTKGATPSSGAQAQTPSSRPETTGA
jgi:Zn-dependent protease/CBS domain-containing protein